MLMWCLTRRKESQNPVLITLMVFQLTAMPSLVVVEATVQEARMVTPKIRLLPTEQHSRIQRKLLFWLISHWSPNKHLSV